MKTFNQKKIVLLGDCGVGKTSLLNQLQGKPASLCSTIGVDCVFYQGQKSKLQCWDISGDKRFHFLVDDFFKSADIVALVCSRSDFNSVRHLTDWFQLIRENLKEKSLVVLANTTHKNITVSWQVLKAFTEQISAEAVYDVSDPLNLFATFEKLAATETLVQRDHRKESLQVTCDRRSYQLTQQSHLLLAINHQLQALVKKSRRWLFHRKATYHQPVIELLADIRRGVEDDIDQIKERLEALAANELQPVIDFITTNQEAFEVSKFEHCVEPLNPL